MIEALGWVVRAIVRLIVVVAAALFLVLARVFRVLLAAPLRGANWLMVGPTGPRRLRRIARWPHVHGPPRPWGGRR